MADGTSAESEVRPPWPEGDSGTVLLDCAVSLSVDEVFLLLYGGVNDFRVRIANGVLALVNCRRKNTKPCV